MDFLDKLNEKGFKYKFRLMTLEEDMLDLGRYVDMFFINVRHIYEADGTDEKKALFLGKIMAVLGMPEHYNRYCEYSYTYTFHASRERFIPDVAPDIFIPPDIFYLDIQYNIDKGIDFSVYYLKSENENEQLYMETVDKLIALIESTEPSDYEWRGCYYNDRSMKVKYGVKNGVAYVSRTSTECGSDDEQIYFEIYSEYI